MGVIRQFWQEIISAVFTENRFIYICNTIICCWGTTNWGAFSTPFLFYKIVIFVIMKKNLIVVAIGVLVLGGAIYLIKSKKPTTPPKTATLDKPTLQVLVAYLYDRGYTVDQLPEDVKSKYTADEIETIAKALGNYKP